MTFFRRRPTGVALLVAIVLLLVPSLAWLQYRWLGQVSEAERERMQRTLRTSAAQFAREFDGELSKAMAGLQVEGAVARDANWIAYAQRYSTWTERAEDPRLVHEVLFVDVPERRRGERRRTDPDTLRLRRWHNEQRTFVPAEWTDDVRPLRAVLAQHIGELRSVRPQGNTRYRREGMLSFTINDAHTLVSPATLFTFPDDRRLAPRIDILGFTLIRLDPAVLEGALLPALAARHFHGTEGTNGDYRLAVTDRNDPHHVIWESDEGAAEAIGTAPDVVQPFMAPRPDQVFMIGRDASRGADPDGRRPQPPAAGDRVMISVMQDRARQGPGAEAGGRGFESFEGRWHMAAIHRAGSLEAAVGMLRTRNLMLSSGILLLLTTAIGLIVISARRAQTLARQQMEFVAAVSHELRTPVSVIGTAAGNLADGVVADPARVRKYGETIQGEARRLAETVERVLQLAGIAAGRAAATRVPLDARELVTASLAACRSQIESAGSTVDVAIGDNLPPVTGDAAALRAALQNLISNAVKYGGGGKWVGVSVQNAPSGAGQVAFSVADRGIGITADDRKHIFEPFYRGREAVADQIQGSGLGLNLVQRIAEAHDGRVTVTTEHGKGSTFTLLLPAASTQSTAEPAMTADGVPGGVGAAL